MHNMLSNKQTLPLVFEISEQKQSKDKEILRHGWFVDDFF